MSRAAGLFLTLEKSAPAERTYKGLLGTKFEICPRGRNRGGTDGAAMLLRIVERSSDALLCLGGKAVLGDLADLLGNALETCADP